MISEKQEKILAFPYSKYDALICDGAVRSGKTSIMMIAFIDWAMRCFDHRNFIIGGNTTSSVIRNVIDPYISLTYSRRKYSLRWRMHMNKLEVSRGAVTNNFYVFGGNNSSSYMAVQGITAAGCLIDEVAICDRRFVEQCMARCSVEGSKFFFNCNPENPEHWFHKEWIQNTEIHNAFHMRFTIYDNPSLSPELIHRYETMFTGVFHRRYILGMWTKADGLVYPDYEEVFEDKWEGEAQRWCISCDYGIQNAFAALKWAYDGEVWHCVQEYYYSGRTEGHQKTDVDYCKEMELYCEDIQGRVEFIVDPSATSFIIAMKRNNGEKFKMIPAINDVMDGIRETSSAMKMGRIRIGRNCKQTFRELSMYSWDSKASEDRPIKEEDHACDAIRYFVKSKHIAKIERERTWRFR